jgi:hypothetical protein
MEVPPNIRVLMYEPTLTLTFRFLDPVHCLIRLLMQGPLSSDPTNLALFPQENTHYSDFANGEKLKRIYNALPVGSAALTSVLFFDSINRDEKGFSKGDGVIIVGAFFTKQARDSSLAKISLGSLPPIHIAKCNRLLKAAVDFNKAARNLFYGAIYKCYTDFNDTDGVTCELQHGEKIHMAKAIILAIYTDQPAATKLSVTGSACPQCYTAKNIMGTPPRVRGTPLALRTPHGMKAKRRTLGNKTGTNLCTLPYLQYKLYISLIYTFFGT